MVGSIRARLHFQTSSQSGKPRGGNMRETSLETLDAVTVSKELDDAANFFLSAPSFSSKQRALELLLRKVYLDGLQYDPHASGHTG
jgi:hypothetical protein